MVLDLSENSNLILLGFARNQQRLSNSKFQEPNGHFERRSHALKTCNTVPTKIVIISLNSHFQLSIDSGRNHQQSSNPKPEDSRRSQRLLHGCTVGGHVATGCAVTGTGQTSQCNVPHLDTV